MSFKISHMLTEDQQKYLLTIPEDKKAVVRPYNPKILDIVNEIKRKIRDAGVALEILFMGASALGISGQQDIDLYILCSVNDFDTYLPRLEAVFGSAKRGKTSNAWEFSQDGFEVEMYLTDPTSPSMERQIKVFEMLKGNKDLLAKYQAIKESANGMPFREYMRRKYEFYNEILQ